jgi:hypothetical protein
MARDGGRGARAVVLVALIGMSSAALPATAAMASNVASSNANCLGIVLSVEAPSAPQFIGGQIAERATSGPGALAATVGELAHFRGGSYAVCEG